MIDPYTHLLNKLKELYPEIYIKLHHLPESSIKGIINNFINSRYRVENKDQVEKFFSNQPLLKEFTEVELTKKP